MVTYAGYGNEPTLSTKAQDRTFLREIGQTTVPGTTITGRTADEAYNKYKAYGASEADLAKFAREIRAKFG